MPERAAHVPHVESGAYPLRPGCAVRPWVDGAHAFDRICEAVEAARRSVWVTVAFLERDVAMPLEVAHTRPAAEGRQRPLPAYRQHAVTELDDHFAGHVVEATLARGYSLTRTADGKLIRSVEQVRAGMRVVTRVSDGQFASEVSSERVGT